MRPMALANGYSITRRHKGGPQMILCDADGYIIRFGERHARAIVLCLRVLNAEFEYALSDAAHNRMSRELPESSPITVLASAEWRRR